MIKRIHLAHKSSCPFLPEVDEVVLPSATYALRNAGKPEQYYLTALQCAQSLWLQGKPSQSLLQLNHALSVRIQQPEHPLPYAALRWIITHRHHNEFIGNPVRHYQHLATRVSGRNRELRSWRAWACFHLAESILPSHDFPRDIHQIDRVNLTIPIWSEVLNRITHLGSGQEAILLQEGVIVRE